MNLVFNGTCGNNFLNLCYASVKKHLINFYRFLPDDAVLMCLPKTPLQRLPQMDLSKGSCECCQDRKTLKYLLLGIAILLMLLPFYVNLF
jgi:hypothetical protein